MDNYTMATDPNTKPKVKIKYTSPKPGLKKYPNRIQVGPFKVTPGQIKRRLR